MLNKINKIYFTLGLLALPLFASAQQLGKTRGLLESIQSMVTDILIPLVFTLALLFFFWGMVKYIWVEGQGKDEGKKFMIWGVVALAVMTCIWGLVSFISTELGLENQGDISIPTIGT